MKTTFYVLSGPLIWLGSLVLLLAIGARGCAPGAVVTTIQLIAVGGCVAVLYHALSYTRQPAVAERRRIRHFIAGGAAVLGAIGIGGTALVSALGATCR